MAGVMRCLFLCSVLLVLPVIAAGQTASLQISFDPNPAPQYIGDNRCFDVSPEWDSTVTVTETGGVGVTITRITTDFFDSNGNYIRTQTNTVDIFADEFNACGPGSRHIPAHSQACGFLCFSLGGEDSGSIIWNFFGIDDNGNEISARSEPLILLGSGSEPPPPPPTEAQPNLQPTEITFDPSTAIVGGTVFFDSGVNNTGDADTGVFNVQWLVNNQDVVAAGSHAGVPAGQTVLDGNSQFSWTFDSPGTYSVSFTVDFDNQIEESNEGDNTTTIDVVVAPQPPTEPQPPDVVVPLTLVETKALVDLPGVTPESLMLVSVEERPTAADGTSTAIMPRDYYSFIYAVNETDAIVGMYYGLPDQGPLDQVVGSAHMKVYIFGKSDLHTLLAIK